MPHSRTPAHIPLKKYLDPGIQVSLAGLILFCGKTSSLERERYSPRIFVSDNTFRNSAALSKQVFFALSRRYSGEVFFYREYFVAFYVKGKVRYSKTATPYNAADKVLFRKFCAAGKRVRVGGRCFFRVSAIRARLGLYLAKTIRTTSFSIDTQQNAHLSSHVQK